MWCAKNGRGESALCLRRRPPASSFGRTGARGQPNQPAATARPRNIEHTPPTRPLAIDVDTQWQTGSRRSRSFRRVSSHQRPTPDHTESRADDDRSPSQRPSRGHPVSLSLFLCFVSHSRTPGADYALPPQAKRTSSPQPPAATPASSTTPTSSRARRPLSARMPLSSRRRHHRLRAESRSRTMTFSAAMRMCCRRRDPVSALLAAAPTATRLRFSHRSPKSNQ